jgi:hypothetical protein
MDGGSRTSDDSNTHGQLANAPRNEGRGTHPERFPGGLIRPAAWPTEVWINPPNRPVR